SGLSRRDGAALALLGRRAHCTGGGPSGPTGAAWLACKPLHCVRESPRHTAFTGGRRLPILPDCNRSAVSCSPLEGDCRPRADKLTGPARVRFFFGPRFERTSFAHPGVGGSLLARPPRTTLVGFCKLYGGRPMAWTTPSAIEMCVG